MAYSVCLANIYFVFRVLYFVFSFTYSLCVCGFALYFVFWFCVFFLGFGFVFDFTYSVCVCGFVCILCFGLVLGFTYFVCICVWLYLFFVFVFVSEKIILKVYANCTSSYKKIDRDEIE